MIQSILYNNDAIFNNFPPVFIKAIIEKISPSKHNGKAVKRRIYIKGPINNIKNARETTIKGRIVPILRDFDSFFLDFRNKKIPTINNNDTIIIK